MHRHHALTQEPMTPETLAQWIKNNSKDHFTHTKKNWFTEDEKIEMQRTQSDLTREIIKLNDQKKLITEAFTKGNNAEYEVTVPVTTGTKTLTETRDRICRELDKGYSSEDRTVYAIPCEEDACMYHFDNEGNVVDEMTRPLSQREIREYFGELFFHKASNQ